MSAQVCIAGVYADECSYEHRNIEEPAILLGGAFVVDVASHAEEHGAEKEKQRQTAS